SMPYSDCSTCGAERSSSPTSSCGRDRLPLPKRSRTYESSPKRRSFRTSALARSCSSPPFPVRPQANCNAFACVPELYSFPVTDQQPLHTPRSLIVTFYGAYGRGDAGDPAGPDAIAALIRALGDVGAAMTSVLAGVA